MFSSIVPSLRRLLWAILASVSLHTHAAPQYMATLLAPPKGSDTAYASAISNAGVVGYAQSIGSLGSDPVYWTLDGKQTLLPTLWPSSTNNRIHYANDINNAGEIVGRSSTISNEVHAYQLQNGRLRDIGTLQSGLMGSAIPSGNALGINEHSSIVGESNTSAGLRAFLWSSENGMRNLGVLAGGSFSSAHAINDVGAVVGESEVEGGRRAFLWTEGGGMQDLGDFAGGANSSTSEDINDAGQVVGYSSATTGSRAFLWTAAQGMVDLGVLSGHAESYAHGINESGFVVGISRTSDWREKPFLWTVQDGMIDLNKQLLAGDPLVSSGLTLTRAAGINDAGQILVSGLLKGQRVIAVLTPVPEPSTWALGLLGSGLLLSAVRRARKADH